MKAVPETGFGELLRWLFRRRRRYRVNGPSMIPTLRPGEEVLADPYAYRRAPPGSGDIVVALHPYKSQLKVIKRVATVLDNGHSQLIGDNPEASTDFQAVPPEKILGRVTSKIP